MLNRGTTFYKHNTMSLQSSKDCKGHTVVPWKSCSNLGTWTTSRSKLEND